MTTARKKPAALVPSAVSAWGDEPAQREHELPSGRVMTLRRGPSMRRLVMQGVVPSSLLGVELVPSDADPTKPTMSINSKLFEEQRAAVVCAMAVTPPVVMEPLDDGESLLYDLLDDQDISYIVAWTAEGLAGVAGFPGLAGSDADGPGGDEAGDPAE